MHGLYILDENGEPKEAGPDEWRDWMIFAREHRTRQTEETILVEGSTSARISTVFMAIDHGFGEKLPVLWETMVFGLSSDYTRRYTSLADAKEAKEHIGVTDGK